MNFSFSLFEPKRNRVVKTVEPLVAVNPNGRIIFNKKAAELLSNNRFCMLGYDSKNNAVGVLPLAENKINSFPIRYAAKGAYIGAKKFFKHFNILPQQLIENTPIKSDKYIGLKL